MAVTELPTTKNDIAMLPEHASPEHEGDATVLEFPTQDNQATDVLDADGLPYQAREVVQDVKASQDDFNAFVNNSARVAQSRADQQRVGIDDGADRRKILQANERYGNSRIVKKGIYPVFTMDASALNGERWKTPEGQQALASLGKLARNGTSEE